MDIRIGHEEYERQQAKIAAYAGRKAARRERLLNARNRTLGRDTAALEAQIREKQERRDKEKREEQEYAEQTRQLLVHLQEQSARRAAEQDAVLADTAVTWSQQGKETTTTWDLNDPDALKKEQCARGPHNQDGLGAACLQKLAGEDLGRKDRVKQQQRQMSSWSKQQVAERAARKQRERDEEQQYKRFIDEVTELRRQMEVEQARERKALERDMADTNAMLIANKNARADSERQAKDAADAAHAEFIVNNPMLREERGQGASATSATRVRTDHWKGFTPAQVGEVHNIVAAQQAEKDAARAAARREAREWAEVQDLTRRAADRVVYQEQAERMQAALDTSAAQQRQAKEAADRNSSQAARERAYKVENDFFLQFGTSDR